MAPPCNENNGEKMKQSVLTTFFTSRKKTRNTRKGKRKRSRSFSGENSDNPLDKRKSQSSEISRKDSSQGIIKKMVNSVRSSMASLVDNLECNINPEDYTWDSDDYWPGELNGSTSSLEYKEVKEKGKESLQEAISVFIEDFQERFEAKIKSTSKAVSENVDKIQYLETNREKDTEKVGQLEIQVNRLEKNMECLKKSIDHQDKNIEQTFSAEERSNLKRLLRERKENYYLSTISFKNLPQYDKSKQKRECASYILKFLHMEEIVDEARFVTFNENGTTMRITMETPNRASNICRRLAVHKSNYNRDHDATKIDISFSTMIPPWYREEATILYKRARELKSKNVIKSYAFFIIKKSLAMRMNYRLDDKTEVVFANTPEKM